MNWWYHIQFQPTIMGFDSLTNQWGRESMSTWSCFPSPRRGGRTTPSSHGRALIQLQYKDHCMRFDSTLLKGNAVIVSYIRESLTLLSSSAIMAAAILVGSLLCYAITISQTWMKTMHCLNSLSSQTAHIFLISVCWALMPSILRWEVCELFSKSN